MTDRLLEGKSVVITGAGSGVGKAAALLFARHGARLVLADIQEEWLSATVAEIVASGGEAKGVRCDVSVRADVDAAVAAAVEAYGRLDVMYNNAGIASPSGPEGAPRKFADNTDEEIERLYSINTFGVLYGCQAALRRFRIQESGGVIVNTASVAGLFGWGGPLYGSTKGAITALTRGLAIEVAKEGIRVNSVCPGLMLTNFGIGGKGPLPEQFMDMLKKNQPMGTIPTAQDTANAALYLASDMSAQVTGTNLQVDGGMMSGK